MGASNWLVAGLVPGVERQPLKKLKTDEHSLLALLERWCGEAVRSGYAITRIVVAYEAGRDGFWLARWGAAERVERDFFQLDAEVLADRLAAGEDRDVLQHGFCGDHRNRAPSPPRP